jgi:hypothetical protein
MTEKPVRSEKHEYARNTLSPQLRPIFDEFVADYKFAASVHHGSPFVSYIVLAEMVKVGWRRTGEPIAHCQSSHTEDTDSVEDSGKAEGD